MFFLLSLNFSSCLFVAMFIQYVGFLNFLQLLILLFLWWRLFFFFYLMINIIFFQHNANKYLIVLSIKLFVF